MNGSQHYAEVERLLEKAEESHVVESGFHELNELRRANTIAKAQVHATLALAAATMEASFPLVSTGRQKWRGVLGWDRV